jgi:hypothetical protein
VDGYFSSVFGAGYAVCLSGHVEIEMFQQFGLSVSRVAFMAETSWGNEGPLPRTSNSEVGASQEMFSEFIDFVMDCAFSCSRLCNTYPSQCAVKCRLSLCSRSIS